MRLKTRTHTPKNATARRRLSTVPAILALVLATLFLGGTAAQAHDELVRSDPEQNGTVSTAPDHITLTFSGDITNVQNGNKIVVTDSQGKTVSTGDATVDSTEVTQKMASDATDETYKVAWRVVSQDGHPIEGTFNFTVGQGGSGDQASASQGASEAAGHEHSSDEAGSSDNQDKKSGLPLWVSAVIGAAIALAVLAVVVLFLARRRAQKNDDPRS